MAMMARRAVMVSRSLCRSGSAGSASGGTSRAVTTTWSGPWLTDSTGAPRSTRSPSSLPCRWPAAASRPIEAALLRAAGGAGQVGEPAAGVEVEEGEEQRELFGLGPEDRLDGDVQDGPGRAGFEVGGRSRWPASAHRVRRRRAPSRVHRAGRRNWPDRDRACRRSLRRPRRVRGRDEPGIGVNGCPSRSSTPGRLVYVGKVFTSSSAASAARWSWVGPIHWPAPVDAEPGLGGVGERAAPDPVAGLE
jgi:hypothetical protein